MLSLSTLIAAICALLAAGGIVYYGLTILSAKRFLGEGSRTTQNAFTPPLSILKSLKGVDPHMYAAFRSHCVLDYPQYELLFGVHDPKDPALTLVERLRAEFPQQQLRVIHCPKVLGMNGKVSTLAQMLPQAQYEHIIINDSDIVVGRDYLLRVVAPFAAGAGLVTTLYRAIAGKTLPSRLEALGVSPEFAGSVLVARMLEGGVRFALGGTIATTKTALRQIGGLESIVDYLADDYELGRRVAAVGNRVELIAAGVETAVPDYGVRDYWLHQLRWARTVRDCRPANYFGMVATLPLPWATIAVLAHPLAWWTWLVLGLAASMRLASALLVASAVLHDRQAVRNLWLLPLRDFVALAVWIASYFGNTIEWRGKRFHLKNGKLQEP